MFSLIDQRGQKYKNSKQISNNNNVGKYEEICLNLSDDGFVQNVSKKGPMITAKVNEIG